MYKCNNCGKTFVKKQFGSCSSCGDFQNFTEISSESAVPSRGGRKSSSKSSNSKREYDPESFSGAQKLTSVEPEDFSQRLSSGFSECDRVLGGGFVSDEVVLLAGTPGAGKSTLSLAIAGNVAEQGRKVVYVSGEESVTQIALRAKRMNVSNDNIIVAHETQAEAVIHYCEEYKPALCIVDSVQTLAVNHVTSSAGSITQSKEVADMLTMYGKKNNVVMILISQVVKSGEFAGSEAIQHIVDATLKLDLDKTSPLRFLRADKNRFGSTDEVGVFQHVDTGLMEITDPTKIAIDDDTIQGSSGTAISMLSEGARFFPVEIQALAIPSALGNPRKQFNGVVPGKTHGICAIIDKFCRTRLSEQDVYINTVSGIFINSPTCDLAIAASLITSFKGLDMPEGYCYIGELSLTGAIRATSTTIKAAEEAVRLGYKKIVLPTSTKKDVIASLKKKGAGNDISVIDVRTIADLNKVITKAGTKNTEEEQLMKEAKQKSNANLYYKSKKTSNAQSKTDSSPN